MTPSHALGPFAAACALLLSAVCLAADEPDAAGPPAPVPEKQVWRLAERTAQALETPITVDLDSVPLDEALERIAAALGD